MVDPSLLGIELLNYSLGGGGERWWYVEKWMTGVGGGREREKED